MRASTYQYSNYNIIGGGIIAYIASYHLWQRAQKQGQAISINIYEKNPQIQDTTVMHLVPSLTADEIIDVVPPASILLEKMQQGIEHPGGLKISDVAGVNQGQVYEEFIHAIECYQNDLAGHRERNELLFELGQISMRAWQELYDHGDPELQEILRQANFYSCREPYHANSKVLHDGYRIDLFFNIPAHKPKVVSAVNEARSLCAKYEQAGYKYCDLLSPDELVHCDTYLQDFCEHHSELTAQGQRVWKDTAAAIWRPAGFINTQVFLPLFHKYLSKHLKNGFKVHYQSKVVGLSYADTDNGFIKGLKILDKEEITATDPQNTCYLFCPGEQVGTLKSLGLPEPEYARFAGCSLMLTIPLAPNVRAHYQDLKRNMYLQQEGKIVSTHAYFHQDCVKLGIGGTNAFYGDKIPKIDEVFAKTQHSLQLNMLNTVWPSLISTILGRDTKAQSLDFADLQSLEQQGLAERWVGSRALAFDGFPTIGPVAANAACITHASSGGVSFAHGLVKALLHMVQPHEEALVKATLKYADPSRNYRTSR